MGICYIWHRLMVLLSGMPHQTVPPMMYPQVIFLHE